MRRSPGLMTGPLALAAASPPNAGMNTIGNTPFV
jgi:hypothetical protein